MKMTLFFLRQLIGIQKIISLISCALASFFELEIDHVLHLDLVCQLLEQFLLKLLIERPVSAGTGVVFHDWDSHVLDVLLSARCPELPVYLIEYSLVLALHD